MPSNKRQRELARRRAERQMARRVVAKQKRHKRRTAALLTIGGVVVAVALILLLVSVFKSDDKGSPTASGSPTPAAGAVACGATAPAPVKKQTFAKEPDLTVDKTKTYTAHLKTSCGDIAFGMDPAKAPHTTNSFTFLAGKKYYDGTFCHRMTNSQGLTVLQCGDPDGTGSGGPGYTIAEENLAGAKYPRGTVAMAKTQAPHSTGSQFFLVDKDSQLPPEYTVVGQMTAESLTVLDKILALGIEGGTSDGAPAKKVYIETFTVEVK